MADKKSTLILTVNLECCRCDKKIRKVIAEFPEIQSQIFDEKNNKVIVSGPFDPEKLKRKLCCKACKYIIDIQIKPPEIEKPKPQGQPKPNPAPESKPKPDPESKPKPAQPKPAQPKPLPSPPKPVLPVPGIPVGPYAPMVCCRPCYEGYPEHGKCRRFGYERGACNIKFFSEEDPSCTIM